MNSPLVIDYYSDILCVWAWIAQRRIEELRQEWGERIELRHHYLDVFGDTATKMSQQWQDRGGYNGFGQHVIESAAPYENAIVNTEIWRDARPATSANAHLILKAADLAYSPEESAAFALSLRRGFFIDNMDIGLLSVLMSLADGAGLDVDRLNNYIENGQAMAALLKDYQAAQKLALKGSPVWVMNSGRQTLFGNVGFRILNANIREILDHPASEVSWC